MEKLKTLLWILFAVGVLIYRFIKQMQETAARESRERPQPSPQTLPESTFEQLLLQMQARNAPETGEAAPATPKKGPRTPGGRLLPQARSQERGTYRPQSLETPATRRSFDNTKPVARRADTLPRAVVTATQHSVAPPYQAAPAAEPVGQAVRRLLRHPADVRAAFVLSEILQRRY
jgi:hypothetical protein